MTDGSAHIHSRRLGDWRRAVAEIALTSAAADGACGGMFAAELAMVLAAHPESLLPDCTDRVAAFAAIGADASASLALVEPLASYMLSGSPGGRHLATVVLMGQCAEHHAEGASAALALIGALAAALAGPADLPARSSVASEQASIFRFH